MIERDINFRSWHGNENKFVYPGKGGYIYLPTTAQEQIDLNNTVEQYTGLKDIDGVEIFEGDIVQVMTSHETPRFRGVVEFNCSAFRLKHTNANVLDGVILEPERLFNPYKVLGNIHEHPELINIGGVE